MRNIIIQLSKNKIPRSDRLHPEDLPSYELGTKIACAKTIPQSRRSEELDAFAASLAPYAERDGDKLTFLPGLHGKRLAPAYEKFLQVSREISDVTTDAFYSDENLVALASELAKTIDPRDDVFIVDETNFSVETLISFDQWIRKLRFGGSDDLQISRGTSYYVGGILEYEPLQ